jgi:neutral ceramidase
MWSNPLSALADEVPPRVLLELGPHSGAPLPSAGELLAGAAEVDLTPPPGMPKAGHSANAHTGIGFRTRLRAHVLHLRYGTTSIALVACDLLAGSAIVSRLVADALADTDVRLPGLFLGATHTHAAPGQFHGNELMNRFSSNRRGFDPAWTAQLTDRIAGAVRQAVDTRRPARVAFGATQVWGLTRNRSLAAYRRNPGVTASDPFAAVNPWLHLLRVDVRAGDGGTEPLAAMVLFSVHGTGISHSDHAYNADVWAYLKGELGQHIERDTGRRAVVGAMEGTHGDVAPAVRPGMLVYPEAERVGRGIGAAAAELYGRLEAELRADVPLAAGLREVDLRTQPSYAGVTLPAPAFGAATLAGAYENETPVIHRIPPFRPGWGKRRGRGPHGAKWIPGGRLLHDRLAPPEAFPRILPVQVLRIGPTVLVGLPFEVTVEAGRRVEAAVRDAVGPGAGVDRVAVSSLANEQFCYLTTPEEYALQRYEGGNTLYGPNSQPFVAAFAASVAADVLARTTVDDAIGPRRFDFAACRYLARPSGNAVPLSAAGPARWEPPRPGEDGYWEFGWRGPAPGDLAWDRPLARVEARTADGGWEPAVSDGMAVDDQGYRVAVLLAGRAGRGTGQFTLPGTGYVTLPGTGYVTRWYTAERALGPGLRAVILDSGGRPALVSEPFG